MPLPTGTTLVTLVATYINVDGSPASGSVSFALNQVLTGAAVFIEPQTITVTLSGSGTLSVVLPATDNTQYTPNSWTYTVTEQVGEATLVPAAGWPVPPPPPPGRAYQIPLPYSLGSTQNLASIVPASILIPITNISGISNTAGNAPVLTPTFANGVAAQLSDTSRDYQVYLAVTTSGTATTVAIGPTSTPANTIRPSASVTAGQLISFRLPAGWFVKWAGTTTAIATQTAIGC